MALWAEGTPLVASWRLSEGDGLVQLEWWLLWSEVERLEVFGQILGVGVCGGTGDAQGVSGWMEGWLGKVDAQGVDWEGLKSWEWLCASLGAYRSENGEVLGSGSALSGSHKCGGEEGEGRIDFALLGALDWAWACRRLGQGDWQDTEQMAGVLVVRGGGRREVRL